MHLEISSWEKLAETPKPSETLEGRVFFHDHHLTLAVFAGNGPEFAQVGLLKILKHDQRR